MKPNTSNKRILTTSMAKKSRKTEAKKIKLEPPQLFQEKLKLKAQGLKVQIEKNVLEEQELAAPPLSQLLFDAIPADPNFDPYINNLEMSFIEDMKDSELKDKPTNFSSPGTQAL